MMKQCFRCGTETGLFIRSRTCGRSLSSILLAWVDRSLVGDDTSIDHIRQQQSERHPAEGSGQVCFSRLARHSTPTGVMTQPITEGRQCPGPRSFWLRAP
jgi:hypothetical protein